jgi:protocatechuate 3,4-dioxygenase beta subunit
MEHSRKKFIRDIVLGLTSLPLLVEACKKESNAASNSVTTSGDSSSTAASSGTCVTTPEETSGPYPYDLSMDSAIFRTNITEGKTGVPLSLTLTIVNSNNDCSPVENARVDIWHCDKDGYYSEYDVSGYLGTEDNTGKTFLRGIQLTDASGQVKFTTIYPGWYSGRATHIHVEVFINSVLKKTTQLAFPASVTAAVYESNLYEVHGQNTTSNTEDQVFADSWSEELVTLTGDLTNGYLAVFTVGVAL